MPLDPRDAVTGLRGVLDGLRAGIASALWISLKKTDITMEIDNAYASY